MARSGKVAKIAVLVVALALALLEMPRCAVVARRHYGKQLEAADGGGRGDIPGGDDGERVRGRRRATGGSTATARWSRRCPRSGSPAGGGAIGRSASRVAAAPWRRRWWTSATPGAAARTTSSTRRRPCGARSASTPTPARSASRGPTSDEPLAGGDLLRLATCDRPPLQLLDPRLIMNCVQPRTVC